MPRCAGVTIARSLQCGANAVVSGQVHPRRRHQRRQARHQVERLEHEVLGAYHFAAQPTVPRESLVANVNMDMPLLIGKVSDVVPIGIEHSTLEAVAQRAVTEAGLTLTPDPLPEEVVFVRSDQYPFVREGVPAIYLKSGVTLRDGGDALAIGNDPARPAWKPGNLFGEKFGTGRPR